jgi:hypothetical protein
MEQPEPTESLLCIKFENRVCGPACVAYVPQRAGANSWGHCQLMVTAARQAQALEQLAKKLGTTPVPPPAHPITGGR